MPVRGRGWYKRPYRISYLDKGKKRSKAFHWPGPWREEAALLRRWSGITEVKTWVVKNEHGKAETQVRRNWDLTRPRKT